MIVLLVIMSGTNRDVSSYLFLTKCPKYFKSIVIVLGIRFSCSDNHSVEIQSNIMF